jgi:hypothetical protein
VLRRAARVVFVALLVVPLAFLGMAWTLPPGGAGPDLRALLFWVAIAASALAVALARLLPPRVAPARGEPGTTALVRLLLGWSLCEAAVLFPVVAFVETRDARLLGVFAVDLLALLLLAPTRARWRSALPADDDEAPGRGPLAAARAGAAKGR